MGTLLPMPPPTPRGTLAGARQVGELGGSGNVQEVSELQPYGGGTESYIGPAAQERNAPVLLQLPPDSLYADRVSRGGAVSFPAFNQYIERPPMTGGFTTFVGRPSLSALYGEQQVAQEYVAAAEFREAPSVLDICRTTPAQILPTEGA